MIGNRHAFQMLHERRPVVPGHLLCAGNDVVSMNRRYGDARDIGETDALREVAVIGFGLIEQLLRIVDQIHLVDGQHDATDAEQRLVCVRMPFRASTRMIARSAVDAPVIMLRVYCS